MLFADLEFFQPTFGLAGEKRNFPVAPLARIYAKDVPRRAWMRATCPYSESRERVS